MDSVRIRRARLTLLLVAAIFLGTPLAAWFLFRYTDAGQGATVNRGTLVAPPVALESARAEQLPALPLREAWTVVHIASPACDAACATDLLMTRQVRLSFGRDTVRLRRVLVASAVERERLAPAVAHPDLVWLDAGTPAPAALAAELDAVRSGVGMYLVDPLGNLMMTYPPGVPPQDLQVDLKRLLKLSEPWMRKP